MTVSELSALSERELEVLKLVATGATNQQIARDLAISPNTVKVHLRNIFEKLGVQSRTEATMEAVRRGWVTVPGEVVAEAGLPIAAPAPVAPAEPEFPPISLPELMPHAQARQSVAGWQHALMLLALIVTVLAAAAPSWWRNRSVAASLTPFSDVGRTQVAAPERVAAPRWSAGAPLPQPRSRLALASNGTRIYAIGGETAGGVTGDLVVYDPATNGWLPLAPKPTLVSNVAAGFLDGLIYVPGGSTSAVGSTSAAGPAGDGGVSDVLEIYDPATDAWTTGPGLPWRLTAYALVTWGGKLYLFGGWDGQEQRAETLIFDPDTNEWSEGPALPGPRAFAGAAVLKDVIYVIGGHDGQSGLTDVLAYDPQSEAGWSVKAPLQQARSGLAVVGIGTQVFALGGGWDGTEAYNEQYDTRLDAWSRLGTPVAGEWRNMAAVPVNNKIYAVGGWSGAYLDVHEQYVALILQLIPLINQG